MSSFNIYMCGVGGQGIGVLSEVMIQSALAAGHNVRGVDTHGLAQRGGIVVSHLRLGSKLFTAKVPEGEADVIVGLERLETYRAVCNMMKQGGTAVYYDLEYQPIHVRMGKSTYPSTGDVEQAVVSRGGSLERVHLEDIPDPRMQNVAVMGRLASLGIIEGMTPSIVEASLKQVLPGRMLDENLEVFRRAGAKQAGV